MIKVHHLNCVKIVTPVNDDVTGHCLLLEGEKGLAFIDTGFGLLDTENPDERIGKDLIAMAGFRLSEEMTAYRQIQKAGFNPKEVKHCILTHLDPDHTGGLADFPDAVVHTGQEEYENYKSGKKRYLTTHLAHQPEVKTYPKSEESWFGLEARKVDLGFSSAVYLIPLFGHTHGHCGVAVQQPQDKWIFYIGDAYYLKAELTDPDHPVNKLAEMSADNNELRKESLDKIRRLISQNQNIEIFGYHDRKELSPYAVLGG